MMVKMNAVASKTESGQYNTHTNICCRCVIVSANKEPDTVSRSMEFDNLVLSHFLATNLPPTKKVKCVAF
jgi:IS1 family transposase